MQNEDPSDQSSIPLQPDQATQSVEAAPAFEPTDAEIYELEQKLQAMKAARPKRSSLLIVHDDYVIFGTCRVPRPPDAKVKDFRAVWDLYKKRMDLRGSMDDVANEGHSPMDIFNMMVSEANREEEEFMKKQQSIELSKRPWADE